MIDSKEFAQRQLELTREFGRYVMENPDVDARLPAKSYVYFEVAGEDEFNRYSRELGEKQTKTEGLPLVCVRTKGLAPQRSRLIDPVIEPISAVA
jgi:hypothetical protein